MSKKKYMSYESQSHYDNRIKQYIENKMQVLSEKSDTVKSIKGSVLCVTDASKAPIQGLKLFGKTTQNGTPSPDNPVPLVSAGDGGSLGVTVAGKNLLKNTASNLSLNGVTFTVNEDGSFVVNGTATAIADFYLYGSSTDNGEYLFAPKGTKFVSTGYASRLFIFREKTRGAIIGESEINNVLLTQDCYFYGVFLRAAASDGLIDNRTACAGIYLQSSDATYEPYTPVQTLPVSTPNGLPGIPVTSGGNYTDETGQQWLCDEKDLGRGVHVQRLDAVDMGTLDWVFDGGVNGNNRFICNNFFVGNTTRTVPLMTSFGYECKYSGESFQWWSNAIYIVGKNLYVHDTIETLAEFEERIKGCMLLFPVATPIENALSAEELAAYAAMHTNYPNTTILNDGGAGMEMKYYTPITSVPMVHSEADVGKFLAIDEHGCVTKVMPDEDLDSKSSNLVQNKVVSEAISVLNTELSEHTHNYAGSTSSGGAATSADKLNTDNGSSIQPVYFSNGVPVATTYTLRANVPSNAKFTDTTYSAATSSSAGLMSANDKSKLDAISESADTVSFSQSATSGNKVGTITINGSSTDMYSPTQTTITGNAGTATTLKTTRYIDGVSFTGSANVTRYATCSTAAGTTAKTASITAGTFSLIKGARVTVKFTYANTASSPTLNVGRTGAKSIYWCGATLTSNQYWAAGAVLDFVYNGTQWELVGVANDTNTTYSTASTSSAGLMSTTMVTKLNGIATGATANTVSAKTATLSTSSWSSLSQTVSVSGVTTSNNVIVTPAPTSLDAYSSAGVYCSAQGSGTLTFKCKTKPTSSLTVNVLILE